MFTGIVEHMGRVASSTPSASGLRLLIDPAGWSYRPKAGDSVAVNGCCLTHAPRGEQGHGRAAADLDAALAFDVVAETLAMTTLGRLRPGDRVNLESSLTGSKPIAGHFVQGHIDAIGRLVAVRADPADWRITVEAPAAFMVFVVPKGGVAVDGVSLTLAGVDPAARRFTIALIPTTLAATTLGAAQEGDAVNLESDLFARTIVHYLSHQAPAAVPAAASEPVTRGLLAKAGFTA